MTSDDAEFDKLMQQVCAGCPEAAGAMYERFSDYLRRSIRHRLNRRLRKQFDSLDFVQSVWVSFIQLPADRRTFQTQDELVAYLAQVAYNKVVDAYRQRLRSPKNAPRRELPLQALQNKAAAARDPGPTPSQVFLAEEQWERLLAGQEPPYREILELLRQGYSYEDISDRLRINPKFIQRFLRHLFRRHKLS
jgi:RNA polymerase sigma factor (sigma-70 family)